MPLVFEPDPHRYTLEGTVLPSVTAILREAGLIDFDGIPPSILEAARARGTAVHQAVHYYNENDLNVRQFSHDFPGYAGYLESWIRLVLTGRLQTVLCEHRVASRTYAVAGTIDWIGFFDSWPAVIDFATGDPEDVAKDLQTAAYVKIGREWALESEETVLRAFFEAHPHVRRYSVRLKKSGILPTPYPYTSIRDTSDFFALVTAQQIVKARKPTAIDWAEWAA